MFQPVTRFLYDHFPRGKLEWAGIATALVANAFAVVLLSGQFAVHPQWWAFGGALSNIASFLAIAMLVLFVLAFAANENEAAGVLFGGAIVLGASVGLGWVWTFSAMPPLLLLLVWGLAPVAGLGWLVSLVLRNGAEFRYGVYCTSWLLLSVALGWLAWNDLLGPLVFYTIASVSTVPLHL